MYVDMGRGEVLQNLVKKPHNYDNDAIGHDENGPGMKKFMYDNKVYTLIFIA